MATVNDHIFNHQSDFLEILKEFNNDSEGTDKPESLSFRVKGKSYFTRVFLESPDKFIWLRTDELVMWLKTFSKINVEDIQILKFYYIAGLINPYESSSRSIMLHSGDHYEVCIDLTYKTEINVI